MKLCVEHLQFAYRNCFQVLRDISFSADRGEFLSVLGPNGCGKSTLFRCILGILPNYTGSVLLDGEDVRQMPPKSRARHIAYIPQTHRPTFGYTVLDTAMMGTTRQLSPFAAPGEEQIQQAHAALRRVGVEHLAARNFAHLSGGEQQLVLIARAIAQQADILIMDEPTSALDYGNQIRVLERVKQLSQEGYTVLLSTHNPQQALTYADRILAISHGGVVADGRPEQMLTAELMGTLYNIDVNFAQTAHGTVIVPGTGGSV